MKKALLYILIGVSIGIGAVSLLAQSRDMSEAALNAVCADDDVTLAAAEQVRSHLGRVKVTPVHIDMGVIIALESSGNPRAVSSKGCRGLCQISESTWNECVPLMGGSWQWSEDAFDPGINRMVGNFYMNKRIPQMLRIYGIPDRFDTRLAAYHAGIGNLTKWYADHGDAWWEASYAETRTFIQRYAERTGQRNYRL